MMTTTARPHGAFEALLETLKGCAPASSRRSFLVLASPVLSNCCPPQYARSSFLT